MIKLPKTLRFFRKPDHITFLIGYIIILAYLPLNFFELNLISVLFFTFTLIYEIYEISKGNRNIVKVDHIAFVIGYVLLLVTFWQNYLFLTLLAAVLFGFVLGYEVYTVRKKDLEKLKRKNTKI